MRVIRVYHAGRDRSHRERERALTRAGVDVTLLVPTAWPGADDLCDEPFAVRELAVRRPGNVNGHWWADTDAVRRLVAEVKPDVVDLHEEPFSVATRQLLSLLRPTQPVVAYTAQNLDKRFPPPFAQWERRALARLDGLYPCSRQAASVAVGKGFRGEVRVLPLGVDPQIVPGRQSMPASILRLLLVGRLVPEKGVVDAVEVVAGLAEDGIVANLLIVGSGPEEQPALDRAEALGVRDRVVLLGWADAGELAQHYARAHFLLAPSRSTRTWVEQFGRMLTEAQRAGAVVVGYASGSIPEVVGDAGALVREGDIAGLTRVVAGLVREPARWRDLRDAGLDASQACAWDEIAAGQVELYRRAADHGTAFRVALPDRRNARERFGEPARVPGSARPFALPYLRNDTALSRLLEHLLDKTSG